jgi:hypothetical protein
MSHDPTIGRLNGAAHDTPTAADLLHWVIAYVDLAQGFCGRLARETGGVFFLEDAYTVLGGYQVGAQGVGRAFILTPCEMLAGVREKEVRPVHVLRLGTLADGDLRAMTDLILKAIGVAEQMRSAVVAQRAGITVMPAGTKLPPMPARRS